MRTVPSSIASHTIKRNTNGEKDMEEESLETKKSAVLGQQHPRREAIHVKATTLVTRKMCMWHMDHSFGIP